MCSSGHWCMLKGNFDFQVCLLRRQYQCEAGIYLIKFTIPRIQGLISTLHSPVVTIFYTSICLFNSNQCGARTDNEIFISDPFEVKEMEELLCQLKNIHALLVWYLNLTLDIIYLRLLQLLQIRSSLTSDFRVLVAFLYRRSSPFISP